MQLFAFESLPRCSGSVQRSRALHFQTVTATNNTRQNPNANTTLTGFFPHLPWSITNTTSHSGFSDTFKQKWWSHTSRFDFSRHNLRFQIHYLKRQKNLQICKHLQSPVLPQRCMVKIHRRKFTTQRLAGKSSTFVNIAGNTESAFTASVHDFVF